MRNHSNLVGKTNHVLDSWTPLYEISICQMQHKGIQ
ncbi:hypothetical protein X975_07262, partial [Stegodyphus mimosarum]